jgi:hypothetical protein
LRTRLGNETGFHLWIEFNPNGHRNAPLSNRLDALGSKYQQQHRCANRKSKLDVAILSQGTFPPTRQAVLGTERPTPLMAGSIPQRTLFF